MSLVGFFVERHHWVRLAPAYVRFVSRLAFDIGEPLPPRIGEHLDGFEGETDRMQWRAVDGEVLFRGGGATGFRFTGRMRFEGGKAVVTWAPYPLLSMTLPVASMVLVAAWDASSVAAIGVVLFALVVTAASRRSAEIKFREVVYLPLETGLIEHLRRIEEE